MNNNGCDTRCPIGDCDHNVCGICHNGGFCTCNNTLIIGDEMDDNEMEIYDG